MELKRWFTERRSNRVIEVDRTFLRQRRVKTGFVKWWFRQWLFGERCFVRYTKVKRWFAEWWSIQRRSR